MIDLRAPLQSALADRYRIERELGAGGMATVYLAHDVKHDRKVALKVLKPELAAVLGAERFVVEIKTTASLQHPHILPLFDSGTAGGFLYYVMPFIDGETLRARLNRETQLGVDDAVRIARDIADALDYAHRHGVIHRDIKPENILLHDGRPMVADFGIALAVSAAAGGRMTETGLSLGTPHYMSPEQATAEKDITPRADVYSLASVLYEMLAGEPPHMGNSAQQIIMKIIVEPAQPVTKLRKSVPANVAAALSKALEKLPADRFASAKAFADALADASFTTATSLAPSSLAARQRASRTTAVLGAACVVLLAAAAWGWSRPQPSPPVVRYQFAPRGVMPFGVDSQARIAAALLPTEVAALPAPTPAPDGSFLVYHDVGDQGTQLWMKKRESPTGTPLRGTGNARSFALSPDGKSIAFIARNQLKRIPIAGGDAITLLDKEVMDGGVAWLDDGTILFARVTRSAPRLSRIPASGGEASFVLPDSLGATTRPEPIAGKNAALINRCRGQTECDLWVLDLRTGRAHVLLPGVMWAQYAVTGHLLYVQQGRLLVAPFDARRLQLTGPGETIADSVSTTAAPIRLSRAGTLVTRFGGSATMGFTYEMVSVDRTGRATAIDPSWQFHLVTLANNHGWSLSPDGSRLAIGLSTDAGDDIWVKQLPRGPLARVSFDSANDSRPRWAPGGRAVTFTSARRALGIYQRNADGTGTDSLLVPGLFDEAAFSPDGSWLLLRSGAIGPTSGGRNITGIRRGETTQVPVIATRFDEEAMSVSPDGKMIAYQSDETGQTEVFVRSFPNTDAFKRQVSNGGGHAPLWSRDGRELFYVGATHDMMSVRVAAAVLGEPFALFRIPDELLAVEYAFYTPWDITADGRFIMARVLRTNTDQVFTTVVAENWFEELKARMKR